MVTRYASFVGRGRIAGCSIKATTFAENLRPIQAEVPQLNHAMVRGRLGCDLSLMGTLATAATAMRKLMLDGHRKAPARIRSARRCRQGPSINPR